MSETLKFLNENSGALTVIFTAVVTVATAVYAVLTWKLVAETRLMREVQTEPKIEISVGSFATAWHLLRLYCLGYSLRAGLVFTKTPDHCVPNFGRKKAVMCGLRLARLKEFLRSVGYVDRVAVLSKIDFQKYLLPTSNPRHREATEWYAALPNEIAFVIVHLAEWESGIPDDPSEREELSMSTDSQGNDSGERAELRQQFSQIVGTLKSADELARAAVGHGVNMMNSLFVKRFGEVSGFQRRSKAENLAFIDSLTHLEQKLASEDPHGALGVILFKMWVGAVAERDQELMNEFSAELTSLSRPGEFLGKNA